MEAKQYLYIGVMIALTSCEYPFDISITNENKINPLVVEAMITNENRRHYVYLNRLTNFYDTTTKPVRHAFIAVIAGDSTYYYREDSTSPGTYKPNNAFVGITGTTYYLHIETDSTTYSAQSTMLPVTRPDTITFITNKETGLMRLDHVAESFVSENPAMYQLNLNWHNVDGYQNKTEKETSATLYYYSLTTIDINQLFAPKSEIIWFPKGTTIIERKYSLTKSYELYLRSLLSETQWSGGYFDQAHGNLHSNINNNAAGFFATCTVFTDTIIAN